MTQGIFLGKTPGVLRRDILYRPVKNAPAQGAGIFSRKMPRAHPQLTQYRICPPPHYSLGSPSRSLSPHSFHWLPCRWGGRRGVGAAGGRGGGGMGRIGTGGLPALSNHHFPATPFLGGGEIFFRGNLKDPWLFDQETSLRSEGREPEMTIFGKQKAFPLIISFPSFAPPPVSGRPLFLEAPRPMFSARGGAPQAHPPFLARASRRLREYL